MKIAKSKITGRSGYTILSLKSKLKNQNVLTRLSLAQTAFPISHFVRANC